MVGVISPHEQAVSVNSITARGAFPESPYSYGSQLRENVKRSSHDAFWPYSVQHECGRSGMGKSGRPVRRAASNAGPAHHHLHGSLPGVGFSAEAFGSKAVVLFTAVFLKFVKEASESLFFDVQKVSA
jgi:hypothetical protein